MTETKTIQHRLLIDNSWTGPSAHWGSNYFVYGELWRVSELSGAFPSLGNTISTLFPDASRKIEDGYTRRAVTLYFNGTGLTLYGTTYGNCTSEPDNLKNVTIDEGSHGLAHYHSADGTSENKVLANLTDLYQPDLNQTHTLGVHFSGLCGAYVFFALVDLAPDSVIERYSGEATFLTGLMMMPDDELILYEKHWTADSVSTPPYVGNKAMKTKEIGASMSFIFFGSSVSIVGYTRNRWSIAVSLDNGTPMNFNESYFPPFVICETDNPPLDSSSTLAEPHTINITVMELSVDPGEWDGGPAAPVLQIAGIVYTPTFSSLDEGNSMLRQWGSQLSEISAQAARDVQERQAHRIAAIAGGVVGGFLGLTLIIGIVLWLRRKQTGSRSEREHTMDRDSTIETYRPNSENPWWSFEDATTPTNCDFNPYMETTSQHNRTCTGYTTLNPFTHHNTPTRPDAVTPYMKFYHPTGPDMTMRDPTTAVPYMKHYELSLDPVVLPPEETQEDKEAPPTSFGPPPSSSSHVRSHRESMDLTEQRPIPVENTQHIVPPPSDTQEPGYQLWHQHTAGGDTASTDPEGRAVEPENPATIRRVLRMMESMRARVDALEQPPPYFAAQARTESGGGSVRGTVSGDRAGN